MSLSITEYREKLIAKIMLASSQDEVKRYIDTAMKSLEQHNLNGHIVSRFIEKILDELESFSPMNKEAQQWSNIKMGRICFNQIKRKLDLASQL
ncbi:MAG: hypothetical protein KBF82_08445 [Chitinophagaceae bacterium]|nr:hypothetical protein [Chitinophagaceae bacterium]MBP9103875.1 hypothetical protein [Chitinophagaceae bacterium]